MDGNYRFGSIRETGAAQADIGGLLSGHTKGVPVGTEDLPREPRFAAVGVTGQLSPRLLVDNRFSYVRGFLAFTRVSPFAQVPGTNVALDVGGTGPRRAARRRDSRRRARRSPTRTTTSS